MIFLNPPLLFVKLCTPGNINGADIFTCHTKPFGNCEVEVISAILGMFLHVLKMNYVYNIIIHCLKKKKL